MPQAELAGSLAGIASALADLGRFDEATPFQRSQKRLQKRSPSQVDAALYCRNCAELGSLCHLSDAHSSVFESAVAPESASHPGAQDVAE